MSTLVNLDTPYERRRVIEYGAGSNKVVHHWYEAQHIAGPLYKGREEKTQYGEIECDIYLFFPAGRDGLLYIKGMRNPGRYTPERLLETLQHAGYDSLPNFLHSFDKTMEQGGFIGAAIIAFTRQFDTERGDRYAKYRLEYIARREEKERHLEAERAEEQAQKEAQKKAEEAAARARYLGWADPMTAMQFGRASSVLETSIWVEGRLMTRREFVIAFLKDGWTPKKEEGVITYYGSRWDVKESKPKTVYHLSRDGYTYTITKTEFDFAEYLAAHADCLNNAREEGQKA